MPRFERLARAVAPLVSAALLSSLSAPAFAQAKKPVTVSEAAKRHFQAGVDFLKDPDGARYEEALREFRAAYADSPSWKILGNLALSAMKLERNGEAVEAYEKYVAEAGKELDAAEKAQVEKDVRLMRSSSTTLTLSAKGASGDVTLLDSRAKPNGTAALNTYSFSAGQPLKLLVQSGHHVFTAKAGGKEVRWEEDLLPEKQLEHVFSFEAAKDEAPKPAAPPPPSAPVTRPEPEQPQGTSTLRLVGYGAAGLGGALLLGGVVTGLMGKSKLSDIKSSCVDNQCPRDKKADADSVESLQTTTNVLWVAGGVLAAAGVTMILVGKPESPSSSQAKRASGPQISLSPSLGPQGTGLWATGRF